MIGTPVGPPSPASLFLILFSPYLRRHNTPFWDSLQALRLRLFEMSSVVREKSKLFTPLRLADGTITLKHRIAMAPLTRQRSPNHVPNELVGQYYEQRASDGGLLISEGTLISPMVRDLDNVRIADG